MKGGPARCCGRSLYFSVADARRYHYGNRHMGLIFAECWHHCPKCGEDWCHLVENKTAVGPWKKVHPRTLRSVCIRRAVVHRHNVATRIIKQIRIFST